MTKLEIPQNTWALFHEGSAMSGADNSFFNAPTGEDALDKDIPLLFISFPSEKDPNWNSHPERVGKSTAAIITMGKWEWFEEWKDQPLKRRSGHLLITVCFSFVPPRNPLIPLLESNDIGSLRAF